MKRNIVIYEQDYKITTIHINSQKLLDLFGILGFLQDIASEHAYNHSMGYETMLEKGVFWVLVRQKLIMDKWPKWNDVLHIKTWSVVTKGIFIIREFEMYIGEIKIGECATTWMILDKNSRKPKDIRETIKNIAFRSDYSLNFSANKIRLPKNLINLRKDRVRNSDLDMNNHVNNAKYAQWVLDAIPITFHKEHIIKEFEINFLNETFLDDIIMIQSNINTTENDEIYFCGVNETTQKIAFTSRLSIA
jgi:acyl-ACP thioesterase